jgi:hypothetical protein
MEVSSTDTTADCFTPAQLTAVLARISEMAAAFASGPSALPSPPPLPLPLSPRPAVTKDASICSTADRYRPKLHSHIHTFTP